MSTSDNRRSGEPERPGFAWGLPRELDDLIDRLGRWAGWDAGGPRPQAARWMPAAEEDETADGYRVRLELPGIPRDRVSVEVEGRQLSVRGDLDETAEQQDTYLAHRAGSFRYRTSLPADADLDAVSADLSDGVLTVTVPRSGPAGRRSVPIGGAAGAGGVAGTRQVITGHAEASGSGDQPHGHQTSPTNPTGPTSPAGSTGPTSPTTPLTPPTQPNHPGPTNRPPAGPAPSGPPPGGLTPGS